MILASFCESGRAKAKVSPACPEMDVGCERQHGAIIVCEQEALALELVYWPAPHLIR